MASLDYVMAPGLNPEVYARLPVAIHTDQQSIQDLDVYFQNSLTKGCGIENSSHAIPEGMGSNQVGGRSRKNRAANRKNTRKAERKASRKADRKSSRKAERKSSRKNARSLRSRKNRRQHGGIMDITNLGSSLYTRPYTADSPPNAFQTIGAAVTGSTNPIPINIPNPNSPVNNNWSYVSNGTAGIINPSNITPIGNNFSSLASPSPWQTQN